MREHKKKVKNLCKWKYGSSNFTKLPLKIKLLTFPDIIRSVFGMISLKLELRFRKFRKKEILVPVPIAPWRGLRLGLTLLLKNAANRIQKIKIHRKHEFLNKLLMEVWETYYSISLTAKNVIEFTDKVLDNNENFRSTQFFPVKMERRDVLSQIIKNKTIETKVTTKKILDNVKKLKARTAKIKYKSKILKRFKRLRYKLWQAKRFLKPWSRTKKKIIRSLKKKRTKVRNKS